MFSQINLSGYFSHMNEKKYQFMIILSVFVLQYFFEHMFPQKKEYNNVRNELRNTGIGVINTALLFIPSAFIVELLYQVDIHHFGLFQLINLSFSINILLTIVLMDLAMYWWHRFNHTVSIFWRFHKFHHKDKKMNTTTALRFHIVELLFSNFFKAIFFLLMGFSFLPVLIYEIILFISIVVHHSNINITLNFDMLYRQIFSSPLMHRIHHSKIQEETDTNYGSVFSCWDRLFKTYKKEAGGEIIFGIDENKI